MRRVTVRGDFFAAAAQRLAHETVECAELYKEDRDRRPVAAMVVIVAVVLLPLVGAIVLIPTILLGIRLLLLAAGLAVVGLSKVADRLWNGSRDVIVAITANHVLVLRARPTLRDGWTATGVVAEFDRPGVSVRAGPAFVLELQDPTGRLRLIPVMATNDVARLADLLTAPNA